MQCVRPRTCDHCPGVHPRLPFLFLELRAVWYQVQGPLHRPRQDELGVGSGAAEAAGTYN